MFRSGRGLSPSLPIDPPPSAPGSPTPSAYWEKEIVFKIRSNFGPEKVRLLQYCSFATRGLLRLLFLLMGRAMTSSRQYFPSAATSGLFGPPGEFVPPWTTRGPQGTLSRSFLLQKSPRFPLPLPFFVERSGIDTPVSHKWSWLFCHMRSTMQCVWHWMNEWMKDGRQALLRYFSSV